MACRQTCSLLAIAILMAVLPAASPAVADPSFLSLSVFTDNRSDDDPFGNPGHTVSLQASVADPAGVPANILSVTASNLATNETVSLPFASSEANVFQGLYIRFVPFADSRLGVWRFTVTNKQGQMATLDSHNLDKPKRLLLPMSITLTNFPGTATAPPRVSFDRAPDATSYNFEIYNASLVGLYVTNSPTPSFQVPFGLLVAGQQFLLRARAVEGDLTEPVIPRLDRTENRSVNSISVDPGIFLGDKVATASSVTGGVQATFQGNTQPVAPGSLVVKGTELNTAVDGRVEGICTDGTRFTVDQSSSVFFDDSPCSPAGSGMLDVTQGTLTLATAGPSAGRGGVRAENRIAGVRTPISLGTPIGDGADFTTTYNQVGSRGTVTTIVRSGTVAVNDTVTGRMTTLTAGQQNTIIETVPGLAAAILPSSRSVQVGRTATVFATMLNGGTSPAIVCEPSLTTNLPVRFSFQTTNPSTNQLIGTKRTPISIPPGGGQSFVLAFTPTAPIDATDLTLTFACGQTQAPVTTGVNTILLSASTTPIPDIVALAATIGGTGIVTISSSTGTGVFAVATVNVGVGALITAAADTASAAVPVVISLCQTDSAGLCLLPPSSTVTLQINATATPTFGIFVTGTGPPVPFDPANNRIFVRFKDAEGVTRGSTSVAVRTQ